MMFDAMLRVNNLRDVAQLAREYEAAGFDGLWAAESDHDPYLLLALATSGTQTVTLGTAVALAFNRSPMSIAQTAWNLQAASGGRFVLGLGSQVRAHVERRFSAAWERPVDRMREVVASLRAIWRCWGQGDELNFEGEFYHFTLMSPAFTPPPLMGPQPPIYLGGVNPGMIRLAGELCEGLHIHPFHSVDYLTQTILPALQEGAASIGRPPDEITLSASVFCVTDQISWSAVRDQLSFYASTEAYRPVLAAHGWEDISLALGRMAASGQWDKMPALISDEMIETFAIVGEPEEIRHRLLGRYGGLVQRITMNQGRAAERFPNYDQ